VAYVGHLEPTQTPSIHLYDFSDPSSTVALVGYDAFDWAEACPFSNELRVLCTDCTTASMFRREGRAFTAKRSISKVD
jgi:hypothetical protein